MTLRFSKKELVALLISIILAVILILGSYFFYLNPKKAEMSNMETQLQSEEQLLAALQDQLAKNSLPTSESIAELQKKVPVKQQLEMLILDLEKAEVLSDSFISNMSFSEADVPVPAQQEQSASQENQETTNQAEQTSDQTNQDTTDQADSGNPAGEEVKPLPLPAGVKKLTVTLSVTSPSFYELIKFIETVENLNRLVVIESVSFSGGSELTSLEAEAEPLTYALTFSAFYMPTLEDLQDHLPELVTPSPSNKTNPFSSFPELPEEEIE